MLSQLPPDHPLKRNSFFEKKSPPKLRIDCPLISFFDRYIGKHMCVPAKHLGHVVLPCQLVYAALCLHARRLRQSLPPLPPCTQLQFLPLQLQRFLRGCVLFTAHALVTPPASVFQLAHVRTKSRFIARIFVRVMSGFVARAEVGRQGARCAYACPAAIAHLLQALPWVEHHCIDALRSKHRRPSGYSGQ
jgi:hypothetical protein